MEDQLNDIVEYLKIHNIDATVKSDGVISFFIDVFDNKYEAICYLNKGFPYSLPEIYASNELFEIIKNIPHVSYWKNICTYDKETTIPNFGSPKNIVLSCINKAIDIVNNGLLSLNNKDYIDEMETYWINIPNVASYFLIGEIKELSNYFWCRDNIVSFSRESLVNWSQKGLVLHTSFVFDGNRNFFHFINECIDEKERARLFNYIGTNIAESKLIIIDNVINGKSLYLGLLTPAYTNKINGFRPGKINIQTAITLFRNEQFKPVNIMNTTHDYLYRRGGTGLSNKFSSVCIVGCGSFGGYLSELLMDYGIKNFLLIDNEHLLSDNIARHLCGFSYVNKPKADSVGEYLHEHNPNILYKSINKDIHEVLDEELDELNKYDYIFVCVGDLGIEKRFCDLITKKKISKPVIIIWGEPLCLACHAIVINDSSEVFSLLYNSNMDFLHLVVENSNSFYKREHGCRSTYIPYSSYMVKRFLIDFLYTFLNGDKLDNGNNSFIWLGDLNKASEVRAIISNSFSSYLPFSYLIRKVS